METTATECPVCKETITDSGVKANVGGKEVTVCCDGCAKTARENPTKYAGAGK